MFHGLHVPCYVQDVFQMIDTHQLLALWFSWEKLTDRRWLVGRWWGHLLCCQDLPCWQLTKLHSGLTHPNLLLTEIPPGWRIIFHRPHFWGLVELRKCRVAGDKWSTGVEFLAAFNWTSNPPLPMKQVSNWGSAVTTWHKLTFLALDLQIRGYFLPKTVFAWMFWVCDTHEKHWNWISNICSWGKKQLLSVLLFYFILRLFGRDVVNILDYPPHNPLSQLPNLPFSHPHKSPPLPPHHM